MIQWQTLVTGRPARSWPTKIYQQPRGISSPSTGDTKGDCRSGLARAGVEVEETHGVRRFRTRAPRPPVAMRNPRRGRRIAAETCRRSSAASDTDSAISPRLHGLNEAIHEAVRCGTGCDAFGLDRRTRRAEGRACLSGTRPMFFLALPPARWVFPPAMVFGLPPDGGPHRPGGEPCLRQRPMSTASAAVGFDPRPTLNRRTSATSGVATGLDYADAAPVTGTRQGGGGEGSAFEVRGPGAS